MTTTTHITTGQPALNRPRDCIEHIGAWAALKRYGLPLGGVPAQPLTVRGADGHDWRVWSDDGFFVHAKRERTPQEQEDYVDEMNSRVVLEFFSKDRQELCARIGRELARATEAMRPEKAMPRACRRRLKKRFQVMSSTLIELTCRRTVSMRELRARLAAVGINVTQPDYMAAWDKEGN